MGDLNRLYDDDLYRILDAPSYPLAEASRLAGISKDRARRWIKGYSYRYPVDGEQKYRIGHQAAIINPKGKKDSTYASFLEIIDLMFVAKFLDQGFSLQAIRRMLEEALDYSGLPHFASLKFFTTGSDIFMELQESNDEMIALRKGGQLAIRNIVELVGNKIDFEEITGIKTAARYYPRGKKGRIVVDPRIAFGRPTIIGRGLTTENIYDLYLGENKRIEPVSSWYSIPIYDVSAAIDFEYSLAA